jgi:hypothetical protein
MDNLEGQSLDLVPDHDRIKTSDKTTVGLFSITNLMVHQKRGEDDHFGTRALKRGHNLERVLIAGHFTDLSMVNAT